MQKNDFLDALTKEAKAQAKLEQFHILPNSLNRASSFFWQHSWQILTVTSFLIALALLYFSNIKP